MAGVSLVKMPSDNTAPYRWLDNIDFGNGLVTSDNKPVLTQIYVTI